MDVGDRVIRKGKKGIIIDSIACGYLFEVEFEDGTIVLLLSTELEKEKKNEIKN